MYTIQSIISDRSLIQKAAELELPCIEMPLEKAMIPLSHDYVEDNGVPFLPLTDEGSKATEGKLKELCLLLSEDSRLVYIEAEIFGGDGTQACWLLENRDEVEPPLIDDSAINHALAWIGIPKEGELDEFDTLGLGRHRNTGDWLKEEAYQVGSGNPDKPDPRP